MVASEHGPVKRAPYTLANFWPVQKQAAAKQAAPSVADSEAKPAKAQRRRSSNGGVDGGQGGLAGQPHAMQCCCACLQASLAKPAAL